MEEGSGRGVRTWIWEFGSGRGVRNDQNEGKKCIYIKIRKMENIGNLYT